MRLSEWFEPALGKVEINQQIIYAALPIIFIIFCISIVARFAGLFTIMILFLGFICTMPLFIRSFTRIKKFGKMIIMIIVPFIVLFSVWYFGIYSPYAHYGVTIDLEPVAGIPSTSIFSIISVSVIIFTIIYLNIRWSKQWNKQFENIGSEQE